MANNEDFYYDYKPKSKDTEFDINSDGMLSNNTDRDISSYTKGNYKKDAEIPKRTKKPASKGALGKTASTLTKTGKLSSSAVNSVIDVYGNFCFKNLGNIIKIISFIVSFSIIIVCLILGLALFKTKEGISFIGYSIILGGTVFSAILFFPLYGIGHIICQNNEILRLFNEEKER